MVGGTEVNRRLLTGMLVVGFAAFMLFLSAMSGITVPYSTTAQDEVPVFNPPQQPPREIQEGELIAIIEGRWYVYHVDNYDDDCYLLLEKTSEASEAPKEFKDFPCES